MAEEKSPKPKKRSRKKKKNTFDPTKPRAVNMKVRCSESQNNSLGYDLGNEEICGAIYLRMIENEDNATPMDIRTTHKTCPMCGSSKWENLTDWELSKDKTRVLVKSKNPL